MTITGQNASTADYARIYTAPYNGEAGYEIEVDLNKAEWVIRNPSGVVLGRGRYAVGAFDANVLIALANTVCHAGTGNAPV